MGKDHTPFPKLLLDPRADWREFREAIHRLARCPADAAEGEDAEEWIVERPVVMAGNGDEDAASALVARPELRALRAVLGRARDELQARLIAAQAPVRFIDEMQRRQAGGERMFRQCEIDRAVAVLREALHGGEADAIGEKIGGIVAIDGPVEIRDAFSAREEGVEFGRGVRVPAGVVGKEDDDIRALPLPGARPHGGGAHFHAIGEREQARPAFFPKRVIVLAGAVIFRAVAEDDVEGLQGDEARVQIIASAPEDGAERPQIWTREQGGGRVFVSIPGPYNWTFDDPLFRVLALRGICWVGGQPMDRLIDLVTIGARIEE